MLVEFTNYKHPLGMIKNVKKKTIAMKYFEKQRIITTFVNNRENAYYINLTKEKYEKDL